jgi:hypothetical protein
VAGAPRIRKGGTPQTIAGLPRAEYYREYRRRIKADSARAAQYAAVSRERKNRNRAIPGWRAAHEHEHRFTVDLIPIPPLHIGHPLFDEARLHIPERGSLVTLYDPIVEDLRSEYVLAVLENRDPMAAVCKYRACQRTYAFHIAPLPLIEELI